MFNRGISILAAHKFFPKTVHALLDASRYQSCPGSIRQAIDNLGEHAKITSLAIDRGFTDGIFLWWLNTKNITFFIPAKANMNVYQDALFCIGTGNLCNKDKIRSIGAGWISRIN